MERRPSRPAPSCAPLTPTLYHTEAQSELDLLRENRELRKQVRQLEEAVGKLKYAIELMGEGVQALPVREDRRRRKQ